MFRPWEASCVGRPAEASRVFKDSWGSGHGWSAVCLAHGRPERCYGRGGHQRDVRPEEAICVWLGSGLCASDVAGRKRPVLEGEWLQ